MKNSLILLLLFTVNLFSQIIPINTYSEYVEATVYFKDSTVKNGFINLNSLEYKIKFKESLEGKKKRYDSRKVKKFLLKRDSSYFYFKKIGNTRRFILLKLIKEGKNVSLFTQLSKISQPVHPNIDRNVIGISFSKRKHRYSYTNYFVRNNSNKAYYIGGSTQSIRFKEIVRKHFNDCQSLIEKITNKEFDKDDIEKVITYYNNCNK